MRAVLFFVFAFCGASVVVLYSKFSMCGNDNGQSGPLGYERKSTTEKIADQTTTIKTRNADPTYYNMLVIIITFILLQTKNKWLNDRFYKVEEIILHYRIISYMVSKIPESMLFLLLPDEQ